MYANFEEKYKQINSWKSLCVWFKEDWLLSNHRNCDVTVSFKKTDSEISGFSSNSQAKTTTTKLEMSQTISSIRYVSESNFSLKNLETAKV